MNWKDLLKKLFYYTAVPKCACCREILDIDERALCKTCMAEYNNVKLANCARCARTYDKCICTNHYLERHMVRRLVKVFHYHPPVSAGAKIPSNELIYTIKIEKRRDVIDFLTDEMVKALKENVDYTDFIITNVPRRRRHVLRYGLDHSRELAFALAKKLGLKHVELLVSRLRREQKTLQGEERIKNAQFDYAINAEDVKGKRILLVDDIVTTGASMGNSATLLKGLGAKEIVGVCVSVAFKD